MLWGTWPPVLSPILHNSRVFSSHARRFSIQRAGDGLNSDGRGLLYDRPGGVSAVVFPESCPPGIEERRPKTAPPRRSETYNVIGHAPPEVSLVNEAEAFLQAIVENPGDDASRL